MRRLVCWLWDVPIVIAVAVLYFPMWGLMVYIAYLAAVELRP